MPDILAVDVDGTVQDTLDKSVGIGVKIIVFLVILLVGWIIARWLGRLADKLLDRVGFNRLADRSGLRRWTGSYRASQLAGKLIYYGLLLIALQLAFSVFGPNPISDLIDAVVGWLPQLFVACVIVVIAAAIAGMVFDVIHNALAPLPYGRVLARAVQVLIVALGVIAALNQVGIATTVTMPILITLLATIGGIAVVGIGGGLIQPMRERWERMLNKAESDSGRVATHLRGQSQPRTGATSTFGQPPYESRTGQAAHDMKTSQEAAEEARRRGI
jgi:hypothetical protein